MKLTSDCATDCDRFMSNLAIAVATILLSLTDVFPQGGVSQCRTTDARLLFPSSIRPVSCKQQQETALNYSFEN